MEVMTNIPDGAIVEWYAEFASIRTGVISNVPLVRRVGVVRRIANDGWLTVYDVDGIRSHVHPDYTQVTVLAERTYPGWGELATISDADLEVLFEGESEDRAVEEMYLTEKENG
jgi:hypothetical protein